MPGKLRTFSTEAKFWRCVPLRIYEDIYQRDSRAVRTKPNRDVTNHAFTKANSSKSLAPNSDICIFRYLLSKIGWCFPMMKPHMPPGVC